MKVTREDRENLKITLAGMTRRKTKRQIFYDLCFCLCAPQTTFKSNIKVINDLKKLDFYSTPLSMYRKGLTPIRTLKYVLKPVRFYNNKAKYLLEAKEKFPQVLDLIWKEHGDYCYLNKDCGYDKREWLVKNIKGMGMKAASHFLRNLGYDALAIIDVHIIKFMANEEKQVSQRVRDELIREYTKSAATVGGYDMLETAFQCIAGRYNLTTAELDALVWKNYSNTDWKAFKY